MPVRAWKARKTLTEALRRSGAPKPRASGVAVVTGTTGQRPRAPARPNRTGLVATGWWVVVDRRCYSDGVWGFSQTVSGCAQGAAGTVLLEGSREA